MKKRVLIIDYGLGNLFSVKQACEYAGYIVDITSDPDKLVKADAVILPGVGAFGTAMESLADHDLLMAISEFVKTGKPFMGICLGMQMLFSESEEHGNFRGLNLINGKIIKFPQYNLLTKHRVPQIQWNKIIPSVHNNWDETPFKGIKSGEYMYFVHSYYALPESDNVILSYSEYATIKYASAVLKDNILGIQFHPEKSSNEGLKIYKNWLK
jgi:glutamine amidotransferase